MEDTKRTSAPSRYKLGSSGSCDTVESRFIDLCQNKLALDENAQREATKLLQETKQLLSTSMSAVGSLQPEQAEQYWFVFLLFSVKRLTQGNTGGEQKGSDVNGYTLWQLLRAAKLNMAIFFQELSQYLLRAAPTLSNIYGYDWENRLKVNELQANFILLNILSKHYKRAYGDFFLSNDADISSHPNGANMKCFWSHYRRFGWLLFLALREHALNSFKDLVTCTTGLVSVLVILIIHIPVCFRNFSLHNPSCFVRKDDKCVDLIASLCKMYGTSEEELRKTLEKANKLIEDILNKSPKVASDCESENLDNFARDGLIYFEDLLEPSSFFSSANALEKIYDDTVRGKAELDDRLFIDEDDNLLGSESSSWGSVNISGVKRKLDTIGSPARIITTPISPQSSPAANRAADSPLKMATTPVRIAMTTAKWLRTVIAPLPSEPSAELLRFFASCDRDVTSDVKRRAKIILDAIFPSSALGDCYTHENLQTATLMDNVWVQQRIKEALKLYYRVLEAVCRRESQAWNQSNLTSLLINECFHRCMLACPAEIVLATYKTATMFFPMVLERAGITAFDLYKVIETFIKSEESFPGELRRHLNNLEERLLEDIAWEKGSSLYKSLAVAKPALIAEINRLGLCADPMPSLDAIAVQTSSYGGGLSPVPSSEKNEALLGQNDDNRSPKRPQVYFSSPGKGRLIIYRHVRSKPSSPRLLNIFASPTKPCSDVAGKTYAEMWSNKFFGKISKLAAVRIGVMVERLQLSQQIKEKVYCLFQRILNQQTSLFFNRHIDTIILCCFYVVAKISHLDLTFKEIINNYKKQPCRVQVLCSVFVDWSLSFRGERAGQDHVDIFTFYNEFFIANVKPFLEGLVPLETASGTSSGFEGNNKNDGSRSGSPKISSFPSVPDMSPKKVSPAHKVYVSPLRSSKMDVMVSPGSKCRYACFGERTRAYQSPSKDLSEINEFLKPARKHRTVLDLNADVGLAVDDSTVASSLNLRSGSCAPSSSGSVKPEKN